MPNLKQKFLLFFLLLFSIYCAFNIGQAWDEPFHLIQGQITLDYLITLGEVDRELDYRKYYSAIYWTLQVLFTKIFPSHYEIQSSHLINLFFSLATIYGVGKLGKILFNKEVGKIIFLILFFYPVFFGHMAINGKDTIIAFSHIWILYFILRYLKKQNIKKKTNNYIIYIGLLSALGTGIQLVFLGSLIPVFLFTLAEIFIFKKIINNNFILKKFFLDAFKSFVVFYLILMLFWIDVHSNILLLPILTIFETLSSSYITGSPFNLVNGNYYLSTEIPKLYLLTNYFFKSPEYFFILYIFFLYLLIKPNKFFTKEFKNFYYKLSLVFLILIFPNLILFIIPFPIYDGMRLFIWTIPYFCIIPGLSFYYFIRNFKLLISKISLLFLSFFIIFYLFNFFSITPYQYTYLNILNGKNESNYKKFENDYWGSSINELVKISNFDNNKKIIVSTCGVNPKIVKKYFKLKGYSNVHFAHPDEADYIIMTNRVVLDTDFKTMTNCFDKFKGENVFIVKRKGLLLSVIRKIT